MSASFKDFKRARTGKYIWHKGDCRDLLDTIPDQSVQLVLTSPPYGVGKEYERGSGIAETLSLQNQIIQESIRILKPNGSLCWQVANTYERAYNSKGKEISEQIPWDILLYKHFVNSGLKLRNRIIWHYEHGTHAQHKFSNRYETLLWFTKTDDYIFNLDDVRIPQKFPKKRAYKGPNKGKFSGHPDGKNPSDVWPITNIKFGNGEKVGSHPCQFPLKLADRCIRAFTNPGDYVVDPFGGVATTVVSALNHRRVPISAEIDPTYHADGLKRIRENLGAFDRRLAGESMKFFVLRSFPKEIVS